MVTGWCSRQRAGKTSVLEQPRRRVETLLRGALNMMMIMGGDDCPIVRSVALLDKVGGHLLDELEAIFHVLGLTVAVSLVLLPPANDDDSSGLTDAGTATSSGELSEGSFFILVGQHEFLATHADASLTWLSVSVGCTNGASDFVDCDVRGGAVHLLQWVLIGAQVSALLTSVSPEGTIVSVKGGTAANSSNAPFFSVIVEPVKDLVRVRLPCVLSHCFLI